MQSEKSQYFVTDRDTLVTYFYNANSQVKGGFDKYPYIPQKYETMTNKEIQSFRKKQVFKFLIWGYRNNESMTNLYDRRVIVSRFTDMNFYLFGGLAVSFLSSRLMKRIYMPFLSMFLEEQKINLRTLRLVGSGLIGGSLPYIKINQMIEQQYLYDIMLGYKERFMPNELVSSNCEKFVNESGSRAETDVSLNQNNDKMSN